MLFRSILGVVLGLFLFASSGSCSGTHKNFTEERLRARIELVWSYFLKGDIEAFASMWSEQNRLDFHASDEEWQKHLLMWKTILSEKPTFELLEVQITGLRARAKMRVSTLEKGGARGYDTVYDYWIFENGDWFLDDAGRSQ